MRKRGIKSYWILVLVAVLASIGILFVMYRFHNREPEAPRLINLQIDPVSVHRIEVYWNYRSYVLERTEDWVAMEMAIDALNGEYIAVANIVRDYVGSSATAVFYDRDGIQLCRISALYSEGVLCIAMEDDMLYQQQQAPQVLKEFFDMCTG